MRIREEATEGEKKGEGKRRKDRGRETGRKDVDAIQLRDRLIVG